MNENYEHVSETIALFPSILFQLQFENECIRSAEPLPQV